MKNFLKLFFSIFLFCSCDNDISFPDKALDACVRNSIPVLGEKYLDQEDLDKIKVLVCGESNNSDEEYGITSLEGIEKLNNLEDASLSLTHVYDLRPLFKLSKLKEFGISTDRSIVYYEPLTKFPLTNLGIHGAGLKDINFLSQIPTLEVLYLDENEIEDISVLAQLNKLVDVDIRQNRIKSLEFFVKHPNVANFTSLSIGYNCLDCVAEEENIVLIQEKNPELYLICNPSNQLLPENCGE